MFEKCVLDLICGPCTLFLVFCVHFVTLATSSRYLWMKTSLVGSTNVRKRTGSFQRIGAVQRFFIQLQKAKKLQAFEIFDVFSRFGTPRRRLACMHGHMSRILRVLLFVEFTSDQEFLIFFIFFKSKV